MVKNLLCLLFVVSVVVTPSGVLSPRIFADEPCSISASNLSGRAGDEVSCIINITEAPNKVAAFGFDLKFPESLEYTGMYSRGELVEEFDQFGANLIADGTVRVGGFTLQKAIPEGANGVLVSLGFKIKDCSDGLLTLENFVNDINDWNTCDGRFVCGAR